MDAPDRALQGQDMPIIGRLYMAFELGEKSWKLSLGDGVRGPSRCTVAAGDTASVLAAIVKAKARCHLAADAPVRSCYEAGRDGFLAASCDGDRVAYEDACLQHGGLDRDRMSECATLATIPLRSN
ncbi:hypothetical protein WK68_27635 [Burkholderia ubonensis]|uniref:hypothetical protein n=1 Tax=Burkholderia ubonensis TaxID=101571 RepID=UPI000754B2CB|nr:hypothetical protein [Burkholderia ubonensis]KVU51948.1 hypothetical protein WK68_27635 [Burkholderia ubonensis]